MDCSQKEYTKNLCETAMSNLSEGNNIPLRLKNRASTNGNDPALYWSEGDDWASSTWSKHYENVCKFRTKK